MPTATERDYDHASPEQMEKWRVEDMTYAFCIGGQGHPNVYREEGDPSVGQFGHIAYCEDCGTDLSDEELVNPEPYYEDEGFFDHEPPDGWEP